MKKRKLLRASVAITLVCQCFFVWSLVLFLTTDETDSSSTQAIHAIHRLGTPSVHRDHPITSTEPSRSVSLSPSNHGIYGAIHQLGSLRFGLIGLAMAQTLIVIAVIVAQERQLVQYVNKAYHDELTGLPNRPNLKLHLDEVCAHAKANGERVAVAFIDLDRFKWANDSLGHEAGDRALKRVAKCLQSHCRERDFVGRYGGDEFVMVTVSPQSECPNDVNRLHTAIQEAFEEVVQSPLCESIGASCGVSVYPTCANTVAKLIRTADKAMYKAKSQNTERVTIIEHKSCRKGAARKQLMQHASSLNQWSWSSPVADNTRKHYSFKF